MAENEKFDFVVIGAGAAGLMAAGQAAQNGAKTLVLEKMDRAGKKLGITGKGRCNLTNSVEVQTFLEHFPSGAKFLRSALNRFCSQELRDFFQEIGVPTKVERGQRVFPESEKALDLLRALLAWVRKSGAEVRTGCRVEKVLLSSKGVKGVQGKQRNQGEFCIGAKAVLIAAGGASYPATGSSGDGFSLAFDLGHELNPISPGLVPLETKKDRALRLQGLSLRNVQVDVFVQGKKTEQAFGELLFTHFGISGPAVLTLSTKAVLALQKGKEVIFCLDLKPALDEIKLDNRLKRELDSGKKRDLKNIMPSLMPKSLIPICFEDTGLNPDKKGNQVRAEERKRLKVWLKNFCLQIKGHRPFEEAIVTAGGVNLKQVDPKSMQSKLVKGVFFAGEVLDIYADTGGFNLQAAFSTGWVAGRAAAEYVRAG